jgi:hypothetical protein
MSNRSKKQTGVNTIHKHAIEITNNKPTHAGRIALRLNGHNLSSLPHQGKAMQIGADPCGSAPKKDENG